MRRERGTFLRGIMGSFGTKKRRSNIPGSKRLRLETLEDRAMLSAVPATAHCVDDLIVSQCEYCLPIETSLIVEANSGNNNGHNNDHTGNNGNGVNNKVGDELDGFFSEEEAVLELDAIDQLLVEYGQNPNHIDQDFIFSLNSRPDSTYTIFLDFDGNTLTNSSWNTSRNVAEIVTPAYSIDSNTALFSNQELRNIFQIWLMVREDYAPFNINVTTQDPGVAALSRSNAADDTFGIHCCIGGKYSDWYGSSCGGVSYINSFTNSADLPNFVFSGSFSNVKSVAEAATHEVGHALGLHHDGIRSGGTITTYYRGANGWAPIMGSAYNHALSQWSCGEYSGANNTEDDLAIITSNNYGVTYLADDFGNSFADAEELELVEGVVVSGLIERNTDYDFFAFDLVSGLRVDLTIGGFESITNLDTLVSIYDSNYQLVETFDPHDSLMVHADLSNYTPGRYYLSVTGVGLTVDGNVLYTDYGSIGEYRISAAIVANELPAPAAIQVAAVASNAVTVEWDAVNHASGYQVSIYNASHSRRIATATVNSPFHTFTGLSQSTNYIVEVSTRAENNYVSAPIALNVTTIVASQAPNAPTGVVATPYSVSANLAWNLVPGAHHYQVRVYDKGGQEVAAILTSHTYATISGLTPSTKYTIYVSACNASNATSAGTSVRMTTQPRRQLSSITGFEALPEDTRIVMSWNQVPDAEYYELMYRKVGDASFRTTTIYDAYRTLTDLRVGTDYEIRIRAIADGNLCTDSETFTTIVSTTGEPSIDLVILNPYIYAPTFDNTPIVGCFYEGMYDPTITVLLDGQPSDSLRLVNHCVYYEDGLNGEYTVTIILTEDDRVLTDSFTLTVVTPQLDAVEDLVVSDVLPARATLSWTAVPNAENYTVSVYDSTGELVSQTTTVASSLIVEGLVASDENTISVVANAYRYSTSDAVSTVVTTPAVRKTNIPNVRAVATEDSIALNWGDDPCASRYRIEYKESTASSYHVVFAYESNYVIEGLSPETTYTIRVKTLSGDPCFLNSDFRNLTVTTLQATSTTTLSAVTGLAAHDTAALHTVLSWNASENAERYVVTAYAPDESVAFVSTVEGLSCYVDGLEAQTQYVFTVVAEADGYESSVPAMFSLTTPAVRKMSIPVVRTTVDAESVLLQWNSDAAARRYRVEIKEASMSGYTVFYTYDTTYLFSDLDPNTTYNIRVKALSGDDSFLNSDYRTLTVTTADEQITLSSVDGLNAVDVAALRTTLSWNGVDNAQAYRVSTYTADGQLVSETTTKRTTVAISGLQEETEYRFTVVAIADGLSDSDRVVITLVTPPVKKMNIPTVSVRTTSDALALTWTADENASRYRVQYRAAAGGSGYTTLFTTDPWCTIDGLEANTTYSIRVKALSGDGSFLNSDYRNLTAVTD